MMPLVQVPIHPKQLLEALQQLSTDDLNQFVQASLLLRSQRIPEPDREADLVFLIQHIIPSYLIKRTQELTERRLAQIITNDEQTELARLTEQAEYLTVERLKLLIELAQLRNTTVSELMNNLGIAQPTILTV